MNEDDRAAGGGVTSAARCWARTPRCATLWARTSDRALDQFDLADAGSRQGQAIAVGRRRMQPPGLRRTLRRNREPRRGRPAIATSKESSGIERPCPERLHDRFLQRPDEKEGATLLRLVARPSIAASSLGWK